LLGLNGIYFFPGPHTIKLAYGYSHLFLRPDKGSCITGVVPQSHKDFALLNPLAAPDKEFSDYGSGLGSYLKDTTAGQKTPQTGDISFSRSGSGKGRFLLVSRADVKQEKRGQKATDHDKNQQPRPLLSWQCKPRTSNLHKTLKWTV
jgi:hypothetical protein